MKSSDIFFHFRKTNYLLTYSILYQGRDSVKGISLDMSKFSDKLALDNEIFSKMCNLRYLKVYNSQCSRDCDGDYKLNFPDGLKCAMESLRYLYWLQFPLEELPEGISPKNLIELNLPYSKIKRLWEDSKVCLWSLCVASFLPFIVA